MHGNKTKSRQGRKNLSLKTVLVKAKEMSTWRYLISKAWLTLRHPAIRMSRCSFHSVGKGWLINLSLPVNRIVPHYTKDDALLAHERLAAVAARLSWMLGPDDAIQFVSGEDVTPRQFYKQIVTRDGKEIKVSERWTIHEVSSIRASDPPRW